MDGSKGYEHHSSVAAILPACTPNPSRGARALIIPRPPSLSISLSFPSSSLAFARLLTLGALVLPVSSPFLPSSSSNASSSYLNPQRAVPGLLNENLHLFVPPPPSPPPPPPPPPPLSPPSGRLPVLHHPPPVSTSNVGFTQLPASSYDPYTRPSCHTRETHFKTFNIDYTPSR